MTIFAWEDALRRCKRETVSAPLREGSNNVHPPHARKEGHLGKITGRKPSHIIPAADSWGGHRRSDWSGSPVPPFESSYWRVR
jgi:hypothetical protein